VLNAVARLAEIPGISPDMARAVIAETGLDMTRFPTAGHLVSWAKISPQTVQSGAKNRSGKTGKGNPYLKGILGEAAAAAAGPTPSSGNATGGWPGAAASSKPWSPSPAPSWSSSGTCSPTAPPATRTSAPATTPAGSTGTARCATTSASSKPSATPSPSPRPPDQPLHHPAPLRSAGCCRAPRWAGHFPVSTSLGRGIWLDSVWRRCGDAPPHPRHRLRPGPPARRPVTSACP